jgi:hypothetical protein
MSVTRFFDDIDITLHCCGWQVGNCWYTHDKAQTKSRDALWALRAISASGTLRPDFALRARNASSGRHNIPSHTVVLILHTIGCVVDVASGWTIGKL